MMETRRIIAYEYLSCLPTLVRFLVFFPSFELDDYFAVADVWGWVKYYREPHELTAAKQNNKIKPTAKPASNRRPNEGQKMEKTGGLFEKKYLLENDTQLTMLSKQNMTLRKALALLNESVALGLLVENWSAYPLGKVSSGGKMHFYSVSYSAGLSVLYPIQRRPDFIGIIPCFFVHYKLNTFQVLRHWRLPRVKSLRTKHRFLDRAQSNQAQPT